MVALVGELHAVAYANEASVHVKRRFAQNVLPCDARGLQVGRCGELVALGHRRQCSGAHARLLALGKHATAVAVVHVVLDVVQRSARGAVQDTRRPANGVGRVRHVVVLVAVVRQTRVVAVAPRVSEVEPVAHFVREGARAVQVGGPDGPAVAVLKHDAVLVGVLVAVHGPWVQGVAGSTRSVFADPHVEVLVPRPLNERLHF